MNQSLYDRFVASTPILFCRLRASRYLNSTKRFFRSYIYCLLKYLINKNILLIDKKSLWNDVFCKKINLSKNYNLDSNKILLIVYFYCYKHDIYHIKLKLLEINFIIVIYLNKILITVCIL